MDQLEGWGVPQAWNEALNKPQCVRTPHKPHDYGVSMYATYWSRASGLWVLHILEAGTVPVPFGNGGESARDSGHPQVYNSQPL